MGDQLGYVVEGCFIPLVATFGILGNLASICVLRDNRLEMKATFRYNTEMVLSILILYLSVFDHHYKLGAIADETAILSFVAKYQLLQLIDGPWLWRGRLRTAEQQLWVLWFAGK